VLRHGSLLHKVMQGRNQVDDALAADSNSRRWRRCGWQFAGGCEASLSTMPRAPMCSASIICWVVMVEVTAGFLPSPCIHDGAHGFKAGRRGICTSTAEYRLQFESLGDGLVAIGGFADDLKSIFQDEHIAHADTHDRVIVCQHDSNWAFHRTASLL